MGLAAARVLDVEPALLGAIGALVRADGDMVMLLSEQITPQIGGLDLVELRPATASDVAELSSAWGQRLGIPRTRPAWIIRLRRRDRAEGWR